MDNIVIFGVGLAVTLIAGIGVITSQVFVAYKTIDDKIRDKNISIYDK
jgi:hypothetical protein